MSSQTLKRLNKVLYCKVYVLYCIGVLLAEWLVEKDFDIKRVSDRIMLTKLMTGDSWGTWRFR